MALQSAFHARWMKRKRQSSASICQKSNAINAMHMNFSDGCAFALPRTQECNHINCALCEMHHFRVNGDRGSNFQTIGIQNHPNCAHIVQSIDRVCCHLHTSIQKGVGKIQIIPVCTSWGPMRSETVCTAFMKIWCSLILCPSQTHHKLFETCSLLGHCTDPKLFVP